MAAACAMLLAATTAAVSVDLQKLDSPIEPIPMLERFEYGAKNGMLLRNGRPHYWIADGSDLGGVLATPLGLWLAKLQGTTWASVMHSSCHVDAEKSADGTIHIAPILNESSFSWLREAIRLGFLTQCPEGFFKPEERLPGALILAENPALRQSIYDHGHHMGADPGSALGLAVLDAKRYPLFTYGDKTGFFMPELNREPGPDPYNERVKVGFREWARAKYGSLEEANTVWRTKFGSWDDVALRHVAADFVPDSSCYTNQVWGANVRKVETVRNRRTLMRMREKREQPELYWDWLLYVQEDTTASLKHEFAAARRQAPHSLVGTDVRGHQNSRDNYVAYDPIAVNELSDVFYIHSSGFKCYDYKGRPYEPRTLHDAICWPLFTCRYFRCNTTKPILNSEDITRDTISASPTLEAMAANDIASFAKIKFKAERRADGGGSLLCRFEVDRRLEADRADGSRRFYLAGRAPAAFGIGLNGKHVAYVAKSGETYSIDVTEYLKFGEPNRLSLWYNGVEGLPAHPECHLLAQDMFGEPGIYGEKQYKSQYWSYLMCGHSGVIVWHWNRKERLRLYQAALAKRLEAAAEIVLPAVRFRKEKVAFLYGYAGGAGLPAATQHLHHDLMDWAGALEFTGHRFDVIGEERFRENAADYPVIVAPDIWCVFDETIDAAKRYVLGGGTLVVTEGSLGKTFSRYRDSGFAAFAKGDTGKGRVVFVEKGLPMPELAKRLAPFMPKPELKVEISPSDEFPCVERFLVGDSCRKVLYLQNWGGKDKACRVTLPAACRGWKLTPLEGSFTRTDEGADVTVEGSQGVAVCILSKPGVAVPDTDISSERKEAIARVRNLMTFGRPAPGKKRVLFALDDVMGVGGSYTGAEIFPHLVAAARALGAEVDAVPPSEWTPELLAGHAAVVVTEGNSRSCWEARFSDAKFRAMLAEYVSGGGSLFADVYSGRTACAIAAFSKLGREAWHVEVPWGKIARDDSSHGFGDPRQILTRNVCEHQISEGVKSVQLFALMPLKYLRGCRMQTVVALPGTSSQPNTPVMAAQESGKGRVAVTSDPMAFQPYRIGEADNAALLLNTFGWLLREKVDAAMREGFRRQCIDFMPAGS